jgi:hypothetical protein
VENELITFCFNGGGFILSGWRTLNSFTPSLYAFYGITSPAEVAQPIFDGIYGWNGYNDVAVDSAKMIAPWNWMLNFGWHFDIAGGDTIALIESPDTLYDSLTTGVRNMGGGYAHVILGFPLYFMETEDAKTFLQKALVDIGAGIGEEMTKPIPRLIIGKPYPEPFASSTRFALLFPQPGHATVCVFDASGRKVKELHRGLLNEGIHILRWNGRDDRGNHVASGIYFIRIETESRIATRKVVFLR